MDILEYQRFLENLTTAQLQDHIDEVAIGNFDLTPEQAQELKSHIARLKVEKIEKYFVVWGLLMALAEAFSKPKSKLILGPLKDIIKDNLPKPEVPPLTELVWVTQSGACQDCAYHAGKIYGVNTYDTPPLHPHCRCKWDKRIVSEDRRTMDTKMRFLPSGAIRAVLEGEKRMLEVLAAPFGSMANKDRLNQFLSVRTDFMCDVGDRRPTIYMHGYSPRKRKMAQPTKMGIATVSRVDHEGLWMTTELDDSELATRTWNAALKGEARASTGSVNYLERHDKVTGEVLVWPIAELSVFDAGDSRIPVSDDAVVLPLRAYFDECEIEFPETFEAGEDKDAKRTATRQQTVTGEIEMDQKEIQAIIDAALAKQAKQVADNAEAAKLAEAKAVEDAAAMRASILEELKKANPQARALFNVRKETTGTEKLTAGQQETHEYIWNLRKGGTPAMRVLEETEAAEGLAFVPQELDTQVQEMRDEASLVSKMGIQRRQSTRLIYNFIREDAGMGALALIAEEGAYIANEPAFALLPATVGKYGSMITATEELLEDQSTFQSWFVSAVARKWALAENALLFAVIKAGGTAGTHSATLTTAEVDAFPFQVTEPWVSGAHLVMLAATMGTLRGLLVGTPRAYGEFPLFGGRELPSFMGLPTHLNSNWEALGDGDLAEIMSIVNPQAIGWVERSGMTIKVDPYGDAANGRIRFFPRVRFAAVNTQALGIVHYTDHA